MKEKLKNLNRENIRGFLRENYHYIKPVLAIALPSIADMFVQTLLGFSDMVMVGKIGPSAISAVGVGNAPIMLIMTIFFAMATGTTAIMSRAFGANNREEGESVAAQSIFLSLPIIAIVTLIVTVFAKPILLFVGNEFNLVEGSKYYYPVAIGTPFLAINIIFAALYRAVGYTKVPMYTNIASVATNVVLNYLFIFVFKMGVFGAGLATTLSRVIVTFVYVYLIFIHKSFWVELPRHLFRYNKVIADRIIKVGLPAAIEQTIFRVGMLLFEMTVISLGTVPYAAHKIALTAESFSFNLGFGFAVAATSLVGQQIGKNNYKEAANYAKICMYMAIVLMTSFGFVFMFAPGMVIGMFTNDATLRPLATGALRIISICQPFLATSMVMSGSLRGAGSTKQVMWITGIGMFLIRVPMSYLFVHYLGFGFYAAWMVMSADLIYRAIAGFTIFERGKWKSIKV